MGALYQPGQSAIVLLALHGVIQRYILGFFGKREPQIFLNVVRSIDHWCLISRKTVRDEGKDLPVDPIACSRKNRLTGIRSLQKPLIL